jgi:tetratricopeptide (TPR) repeat protein
MRGVPRKSRRSTGRVGALAALLLAMFVLACARTPESPLQRALLLADKGREREAVAELEAYLARYPNAVRERRLTIRLNGSLGDLGAARAHAEALSRSLGSGSPIPWLELGHAEELGHRYDAALELYDLAAQVAPRDPAGPRTGGWRAAHWGELEVAEPRLAEAVRRDPNDARTWHTLGLVRTKLGDLAAAEQAYRAGVQRDPGGLDNHIGLATLGLVRDDPASVLEAYETVLRLDPDFADAILGRSWALVRLGRFAEAERAIDDAARLGASSRSVEKQRRWLADERAKSARAH